MSEQEMSVYFLAETLKVPVYKLKEEMPFSEYAGWANYLEYKARIQSGKGPNLMDTDPETILKGFGIG